MRRNLRNRVAGFVAICLAVPLWAGGSAMAQDSAPAGTVEQARAIGVDAYIYFYPLILMDLTRKQSINGDRTDFGQGPMNTFANVPAYPPADFKGVVRSNFDTLYSIAWLDLTDSPVVVSVPNTGGRYYLLPMLDMWTDVFASPGWRTTGTLAGDYAVVPPGWSGSLPAGVVRIDAPADYDAVHAIQAGYKITPVSQWGGATEPVVGTVDPAVDMKTPPKTTVDTMSASKFFAYAAELLKLQPPHLTDQPILAQMKWIGIERGKSFDIDKVDPAIKAGLETAPADAQKLMAWKVASLARIANGWSMNTDTMGVYGNYYLKRAIVSQLGLGANLPEDAIYPINLADDTGKPLDGASAYTLHFEKGATPPVSAFWSITLYDSDGFQVANSLNRFAVSSWMPFKYGQDGSLDLYFQNASPGADKERTGFRHPKGRSTLQCGYM